MHRTEGFSLIEMAVVLVIIVLLLGGALIPLSTQLEQRKISETEKALDEIKEALVGFAIANSRLPRPAQSAINGAERAATCITAAECTGFLPWDSLGLPKLDSWGKIYRYSVTPAYANVSFSLATIPTKTIQTRAPAPPYAPVNLATNVPAVVFSHGRNNHGTSDAGTAFADSSTTNLDEDSNDTATGTFFSRVNTDNLSATGGEFDDIVVWLSPNILFNRLVAAGKLP